MPIKIYEYSNPYELKREAYWNEIKDCPHFCVSQTMVNGLEDVYHELWEKQNLTTINILVNALYSDWGKTNTRIRQLMEVDSAIHNLKKQGNAEILVKSLEYNAKSIVSAIRVFKELNILAENIISDCITVDQKVLVEIYKSILQRNKSAFEFKRVYDEHQIQCCIESAIKEKHKNIDVSTLNTDTIVIHGVHQFSPAILCAIEDISAYKNVILLFNYQEQYRAIYQTWVNVYSLFNTTIGKSTVSQFTPASLMVDCYPSNVLADSIGNLANGNFKSIDKVSDKLEVIEFANMTEFAGYCTRIFEEASSLKRRDKPNKIPTITYMKEQMYSTSGRVNEILRSYFPEQFGERHFLDYPIGHFFVSSVNLWDSESATVRINNFSDIKECLSAGIISESKHGILLNTFNTIEPIISKKIYLSDIINYLSKDFKKLLVRKTNTQLKKLAYMNITKEELDELISALKELNTIIHSFFVDFNDGDDNFQRFYKRIHDFIVNRVQNQEQLDDEMKEIVNNLLERLSTTDLPDTGTFTCLKQTLSYYLSQDENAGRSGNWIVRDFEQIDGDILRSLKQSTKENPPSYHFCCLSDKDVSSARDDRLPWPLDINFFENAYDPIDWKYQVFLRSKMEYKNFKRYALVYGLEFNRLNCKLSYVKTENNKDNDLFHLIAMLGVRVKKYHAEEESVFVPRVKADENAFSEYSFNAVDYMRYNMCPYRFAVETGIQNGTLYRDRFLIIWYMRILLQNNVKDKLQGNITDSRLRETINDEYEKLDLDFKIADELEKTQVIAGAYKALCDELDKNKSHRFFGEKPEVRALKEDFLIVSEKITKPEKKENLLDIVKEKSFYPATYNQGCRYCPSRDICLTAIKNN